MQKQAKPAWDEYVRHSDHALPMHLSGWQTVIRRTYGHPTHYLMAVDGRRIEGVLPLFEVRSCLTGKTLSSLPGGLCAETGQAAQTLILHAQELARKLKVSRLVLQDSRQRWDGDFTTTHHHASWIIPLADTVDAAWSNIPANIRRQVRKAVENGLEVKLTRDPDHLESFYRMFSTRLQQMGTPVFGRAFVRNIIETFPDEFEFVLVYKDSQAIGTWFWLELGDVLYNLWAMPLPEFRRLRPTHLAHWGMIRFGVKSGFRRLDLGRSPLNSGSYEFKRRWGGQEQPIYQECYSVNGQQAADHPSVRVTTDPKFRMFAALWRRLPLPVAELLGPHLRWHMPFA